MIDVFLYALLIGATDNNAAVQHRLDRLVQRCAASTVVKLHAYEGNDVSLQMLLPARAPTADENKRFVCVLKGMKRLPGLNFGFIGNEVEPGGS